MNSLLLRKVMMLAVLMAGYVSLMGADCDDYCEEQANRTPCPLTSAKVLNGICWDEECVTSAPEDEIVNKCGGKNLGEPCAVSETLSGSCMLLEGILRCVVVAEIEAVDKVCPDVPVDPCAAAGSDGQACTTSTGDAGECQSGACVDLS